MAPLLLLSATEFEVEPLTAAFEVVASAPELPPGWRARRGYLEGKGCVALATGVGKVNAAALTALALTAFRPRAVLLVGIGGAYPGHDLQPGQAVFALSDTHVDTGVGHGASWQGVESIGFPLLPPTARRAAPTYNRIELASGALAVARRLALPAAHFGTAEAVTADAATARLLTARHGVAVESMEGAAVAQVAAALHVPLYQVRGVSNLVGDRDKSNWRVADAVTASCAAARGAARLLPEVE
ncbi:MAG: futalosine hydrolase [Trueperaceae bacterium]